MTFSWLARLSLRQRERLTGAMFLLVVFGGFLGAEFAYRLATGGMFGTAGGGDVERAEAFMRDEAADLRMPRPNAEMGRITFNSLGFRGPELAPEKTAGALRVAFMGSSTTFDPYAPPGRTWPEQVIQRWRAAAGGCRLEGVNAGVPGFTTGALRRYWSARVAAIAPDLVFVMVSDINRDLDAYVRDRGIASDAHFEPSWLARNFELWRQIELNATVIRRQRQAFEERGKVGAVDYDALTSGYEARLGQLIEAIRADGATPVLITPQGRLRRHQSRDDQVAASVTNLLYMPYLSIPALFDVQAVYLAALREVARQHDVVLLDVRGAVPGDAAHFVDSSHYTPAGSSVMAAAVVDALAASETVWRRLGAPYAACRLEPSA